jgi:PAS domain S-box-containing protein
MTDRGTPRTTRQGCSPDPLTDASVRAAHPRPWESAEAFRAFVDHNDDLMVVVDTDGKILYVNAAAEQVWGQGRQECLSRRLVDFTHPEDVPALEVALDHFRRLRDPGSVTFESRQLAWNGTHHDLLWRITPCSVEDGKATTVTLCGRDIGPLRRVERELAERGARWHSLLEGMLDPVVVIDGAGEVRAASRSVETVLGWGPSELVGRNVKCLMTEPHRSAHDGYLAQYQRTGVTGILNRTREFEVQRKDGSRLVCELSVARVDVPHQGAPLFIGSFRDVTARRRAETRLRESEERFRAIFDQEFQLVGLLHADGRVIEVNSAALASTGARREEVVDRPFWDTPWWTHSPGAQAAIRDAIERAGRGEFVRFETVHRRRSGEEVTIDFSLKPVLDEQGRVLFLLPEGRDISQWKEAQRRETTVLRALAAIGESASLLTHEIKNPITAINTALKAVANELGEDHQEILADLVSRLRKVERTMRRTLSFARPLQLRRTPTPARALLEEAARQLAPELEGAEVTLELVPGPEGPELDVDAALLSEALENMIRNACEALPPGGHVRLSMVERSGTVELVVEDDGPGILASQKPNLFKPFHTTKAQGTGLGLALCRKVAEEHGGDIVADESPLGGARFTVHLPLDGPPG